jgi:hypothetical protein
MFLIMFQKGVSSGSVNIHLTCLQNNQNNQKENNQKENNPRLTGAKRERNEERGR